MDASETGFSNFIATLKEKLSTALGTASIPGTEAWVLQEVHTRSYGAALVITRGEQSLQCMLFHPNTHESPYYRNDRFDFTYLDDSAEHARQQSGLVIDQLVYWLDQTFPGRAGSVVHAPIAPKTPDVPRSALVAEVDTIREALTGALARGELPELAGWSLTRAEVESFRGRSVPGVLLARGDHTLRLHLLPKGSVTAAHHTERYDVLYDDSARAVGATGEQEPVVLDQFLAWLDEVSRPQSQGAATPTPRAPAAVPPALAGELRALREALTGALARGELAELTGWSLDAVEAESFRGRAVPGVRLSRGDHTLHLHLLPAGAEAAAHHTERYDVLYDDSARMTKATRGQEPVVLDQFLVWLDAVSRQPTETATPRAPMAPATASPVLDIEVRTLRKALTGALSRGEIAELSGWSLDGVEAETFRGRVVPGIRLSRGDHALHLHLLPKGADASAHRTNRYDVLYDDSARARGTVDGDAPVVLDQFLSWLDGALVTREPAREGAAARVALAREVEAALTAALKAGAVLGTEGWTLEHVTAREQSMGSSFVEVAFRADEHTLRFHVMPTMPESRAYRRTARLDLLYEDDPQGANTARDRTLIDGFADWLSAWDTPQT